MKMNAALPAHLPRHSTQLSRRGGRQHGVQRRAIALQLGVGRSAGLGLGDGGEGGRVGKRDEEDVAGRVERGVAGREGERAARGGEVGVRGDGGDEVRREVGIREAEEALGRAGRGRVSALVSVRGAVGAVVAVGVAVVGLLVGECQTLFAA